MKNQTLQNKNLENAKFANKKHGKLTLNSLKANHVPETSIKLKFQYVRFKKKRCFAIVVLNPFHVCLHQGLFARCDLHCRILLYCYAETKEMIYESVNLNGVVNEAKQTSFSLQSINTFTGLATWPNLLENSFTEL